MNQDYILRQLKSQNFSDPKVTKFGVFIIEPSGEKSASSIRSWSVAKCEKPDIARECFECIQSVADEEGKNMSFVISALDANNNERGQIRTKQRPENKDEFLNADAEGLVSLAMRHTENAYKMAGDMLAKQATMQKDLMNMYHKRMVALDAREDLLSEIVREFRDVNIDHQERARKEDRYDRFFELFAGHLTPAMAEKMLNSGMINEETAASMSAAGKEMAEEINDTGEVNIDN